jgi:glucose-specific phosphotransferase system IIA component
MGLFSKKVQFSAPADGKLISLTQVTDEVFSTGMMGKGYAVEPTADDVYSPVVGKVTTLFPTKHAIGFQVGDMEVLLHMGIDTVDLKGAPFTIHVELGQEVTADTLVASMDRDAIQSSGRSATTMVLITNSDETVKTLKVTGKEVVTHAEAVASVTPK